MDINQFVELYRPLIVIAFIISVVNWIGYSILAPWWRTALGRIVWTKFLANCLILFTPFMQVMYSEVSWRYEFSLASMFFFIIAISLVGYGIYTTQISGYLTYRRQMRLTKKRIKKEEAK